MKARLATPNGTRAWLRIYWGDSQAHDCPAFGYHNAMKLLGETDELDAWTKWGSADDYPLPALWPTMCRDCGAPVPELDFLNHLGVAGAPRYQVHTKRRYDTPSGELEPGCLYWAPWHHEDRRCLFWDDCADPRGHLQAILPNGREWDIDSRAKNCTLATDRAHRCWVRHGEPPDVHVDKAGRTCAAGAGSIMVSDYHGFLHHGVFTAS